MKRGIEGGVLVVADRRKMQTVEGIVGQWMVDCWIVGVCGG